MVCTQWVIQKSKLKKQSLNKKDLEVSIKYVKHSMQLTKKKSSSFQYENSAEMSNAGFIWISKTINWLDFMLNLFIKNKKQKEAKGRDRLCQRTLWLDWIRHSQGTLELTASSLIYKMPVQDGDSFSWMGKDSSGLTSVLRMYRHVKLSRVGDKRLFSENPR